MEQPTSEILFKRNTFSSFIAQVFKLTEIRPRNFKLIFKPSNQIFQNSNATYFYNTHTQLEQSPYNHAESTSTTIGPKNKIHVKTNIWGLPPAAEPSTHPTPFPNQPYLGVELPWHPGHVPFPHLDGYLSATGSGEYRVRRGRQTHLSLPYYPRSHRKHCSYGSPQGLEQPAYWSINVLKSHTCSLFVFSSIQAGKLCWRKEELLEYFCLLCSG